MSDPTAAQDNNSIWCLIFLERESKGVKEKLLFFTIIKVSVCQRKTKMPTENLKSIKMTPSNF